MPVFRDRRDAGARLARALEGYAEEPDVVVLALPPGGVPVGYEVAKQLLVPLDVLVSPRPPVDVHGQTVLVIDDGLGSVTRLLDAVETLHAWRAGLIVVALPIAPADVCEKLRGTVDDVVCVVVSDQLHSSYVDSEQPTEAEVRELLDDAERDLRERATTTVVDTATS